MMIEGGTDMQKKALVILGASAAGISLATQRPDALLLEPSTLLASEWLASMNIKPDTMKPLSDEAESLRQECRAIGALSDDGRLYAPAVVSVLASRLSKTGAEIRFQAQIIDTTPMDDGLLVTWLDAAGTHAILAHQLVDTRQCGGRKALCTVLSAESQLSQTYSSSWQLLRGCLANEMVLKWYLPFEADWPQARAIIHDGMAHLSGCRLAAIAPVFCFDYDEPILRKETDRWIICCSASYPNLFEAWDGGITCATVL